MSDAELSAPTSARLGDDELMHSLVQGLPMAAAILDKELVYRCCNRAYAGQFELDPEALCGKPHPSLCSDDRFERSLHAVLAHHDPLNAHGFVDHPLSPGAGWRIAPLLDGQGRCYGLLVVARGLDKAGNPRPLEEPAWLSLVRNSREVFFRADAGGELLTVSPSSQSLLGHPSGELEGQTFNTLCASADDWRALLDALHASSAGVSDHELRLCRRDGDMLWVAVTASLDDQVIEGVLHDITDRRAAEQDMRKLSRALAQTADSVLITDRHGHIEYVNKAFQSITGYSREEVLGRSPALLKSGQHDDAFYRRLWQTIKRGEAFREVMVNKRRDGSLFHEAKTITPLLDDDGEIRHFVSTGKDISERMEAEQRLYHMAHHDALTGLANRTLFVDRINRALATGEPLAVLLLDMDRFKIINDGLGHEIGDRVLLELARRLETLLPGNETLARLSGDEFAVLLAGADLERGAIATLAEQILVEVSRPCVVDEHELFVTASLGISLAPTDGKDPDSLLKFADIAMYRAKELGRNNFRFYAPDMGASTLQRLNLETDLRRALERDEFQLYYQPQVDVLNDRVVGVEALLRWEHPERGVVEPDAFVPLLEETRLIEPVGAWVLEEACRQGQRWRSELDMALRMSVNLSGRQFADPALLRRIGDILECTGFDGQLLEIELTESVIMRDDRHSVRMFNALWDMDLRIAVDDFGTGYSSLSYLKRFPIDTLKIDRSFVRDVNADPDDAAIVQAIIAMARTLNLHVVAEGVETEAQREFLRKAGCHLVQGYLCQRPAPAAQISDFLSECRQRQAGACGVDSVDAAQ